MWFSNGSDTNRAVQAQKMARGWKFYLYKKERNCTILLAKNALICRPFVFLCRDSNIINEFMGKRMTLDLELHLSRDARKPVFGVSD